jgi:hypothetical protein
MSATRNPVEPSFVHDADSRPSTVLSLEFLARQATGLRFGASVLMPSTVAPVDLIPEGAEVISTWVAPASVDLLADAGQYLVHIDASTSWTLVRIAAADQVTADAAVDALEKLRPPDKTGEVDVTIWHQNPRGSGQPTVRPLLACSWANIASNYPKAAGRAVSALMTRTKVEPGDGRLILLHGESGTGKTTVIRALMSEWDSWCDVHLVTDPDRLFADSSYLLHVLESRTEGNSPSLKTAAGPDRWKLVVAEDADAYLRSTARNDAGAALGRLLNTTDGLLAQASRALVLITTNEPLARLHPAVTRPGRCIAEIDIGRFDATEAQAWLGADATSPAEGATLAELYQLRRNGKSPHPHLTTGTYL